MSNFDIPKEEWIYETSNFYIVRDKHPVSPGHLLIISKTERNDFFDLTKSEKSALPTLIQKTKELIEEKYNPDGYNIGINCGTAAGQTIFQFHCHVIPRYKGDMENPEGGVRYCIPQKGNYL